MPNHLVIETRYQTAKNWHTKYVFKRQIGSRAIKEKSLNEIADEMNSTIYNYFAET